MSFDNSLSYDPNDPKSIEDHARKLIGKTLRHVLSHTKTLRVGSSNNKTNKGSFGTILEEFYFNYKPNNSREPDFPRAGVELKSTPLKKLAHGELVPKERLVLNMINYRDIVEETWETSSFAKKNLLLLLIFYLWQQNTSDLDYLIKLAGLWKFPEKDLEQMKQDWEAIREKVIKGKAHEISEGDTYYLGAARKGHKEGPIKYCDDAPPAKQRAFSLKSNYVRFILAQMQARQAKWEKETGPLFDSVDDLIESGGIENKVRERFSHFLGKNVPEICKILGLTSSQGKSRYDMITRGILGITGKRIEEFEKADIILRTIRLKENNMPKEAISFSSFRIKELVEENWDNSSIPENLGKKFLFVVYQYHRPVGDKEFNNEYLFLRKVFFWNMPYEDLENVVRFAWEKVKKGFLLGQDSPLKSSDKMIIHIRPHAKNSQDLDVMPNGTFTTKKSFWLNQKYLKQVIENNN